MKRQSLPGESDGLCPNCGAFILNEQRFCPRCGALFSVSHQSEQRDFRFWFIFLLLVVCCFLAGAIGACSTGVLALTFLRDRAHFDVLTVLYSVPFALLPFAACFFIAREIRRHLRG